MVPPMDEVTIIIPSYGRSDLLDGSISALNAAGFKSCDIIIVDDASPDDRVAETAAKHNTRLIRLAVNAGPAAARNAGAAASADAEVFFFVDSDVLVSQDVQACLAANLADPSIAAVFGCYDDAPAETDLVSLYVNLRHREIHRQSAGVADTFWAGCGAVRREAFEAVGGFDPSPRWNYIEDVEFGRRLDRAGYQIRLDPALQGKHLKRWTLAISARTDALFRARPWVSLMLEETRVMKGLNADRAGRASMLAVLALPFCLAGAIWWPPALLLAGLCLAAIPLLNLTLFRSFARIRGPWFAVACVPLHAFHLFCVGIGLALGLAHHFGRRSSAPKPDAAWSAR